MLQRIQTIWLFLAGAAAILTLKLPSYAKANTDGTYDELNGLNSGTAVLIATIVVAMIAFVTIGLYKNRPLQLKICLLGVVLEAVLIFLYYRQTSSITQGTPSVYAILHMCTLLFFVLAARGISRDERTVKESDRLR